MNNWKTRLKQEWNTNPVQCIIVASLAATAVAKLLDAASAAQGRAAYAKQINYKVKS